jgi:hypothetical protein
MQANTVKSTHANRVLTRESNPTRFLEVLEAIARTTKVMILCGEEGLCPSGLLVSGYFYL